MMFLCSVSVTPWAVIGQLLVTWCKYWVLIGCYLQYKLGRDEMLLTLSFQTWDHAWLSTSSSELLDDQELWCRLHEVLLENCTSYSWQRHPSGAGYPSDGDSLADDDWEDSECGQQLVSSHPEDQQQWQSEPDWIHCSGLLGETISYFPDHGLK